VILRLLLVVNSFASSVTARNTVVVHQRLARHHDVQVVETNRRGHATRFAQDAARRGIDVVVSFGGDGTLNEVATGIAGTDTALAVLPGGSTNVFARTIGFPNDALAAVDIIVEAIEHNNISPIGLGKVNGRYFTFHTGIGYDAAVVKRVEQRASLKRYAGHPLFVAAALRTWAFDYNRKHPHFQLNFGQSPVPEQNYEPDVSDGYFTIVLNTNPYTFLGNRPLDLVPDASLEAGLSVVTFRSLKASHILRSLGSALKGGGVPPAPWLDIRHDVSQCEIVSTTPFPYQLDGDYLGETGALHFEHIPSALQLVGSRQTSRGHI
jgi:diacylglycerol kinase family enzyme